MAVFTLEDEQIVWMDKSFSDEQIVKFFDDIYFSSDIWPSGKTIFPRRFVCRDKQMTRRG